MKSSRERSGVTEWGAALVLLFCCLLGAPACSRAKSADPSSVAPSSAAPAKEAQASGSAPTAPNLAAIPPDSGPPPVIDSSRAWEFTKQIIAFGPRPIGSANHKKVEKYILKQIKDDHVETDEFTIDTPEGKFPVNNIIAKFPGTRDGVVVIASHYDTNWPLRETSYIGANDGASSSALLLELASQLRGKPRDGYSIWLLWDDAEESMKLPWDDPHSLYGVRQLAQKWQDEGTLRKIKAFLLLDMIGDADLNIDRDQDSTPWLEDLILQAATRLGYQSHFFGRLNAVEDDHAPFMQRGVPSADLIDFDYGYNNALWHSTEDTLDKLNPKSLETVGAVVLETVRMLDKMPAPGPK
jgi:glutaminyl-peptide cyclotransferase